MKTPRSPPYHKKSQSVADSTPKFCLIKHLSFLNGNCQGALAQSNALDDLQADRYYPDSRMTLSIYLKNIERKEVNTFMEFKTRYPEHGKNIRKFGVCR